MVLSREGVEGNLGLLISRVGRRRAFRGVILVGYIFEDDIIGYVGYLSF